MFSILLYINVIDGRIENKEETLWFNISKKNKFKYKFLLIEIWKREDKELIEKYTIVDDGSF